ncbi:mitochondrial import protein Pam17-domain-containing protein [Clohesyomyces aquaticus]|uniref:Presequence translocated-associated motor subunit PAM17 n=1 Tax=Clohesyomyces aquaticus TaxID=1231657 RepID=A0A1Y1ZMC3_9PLEO|nr:mitochondrial import protein Pam17-domain-containing protein [Clohesyomyces aquaticus]
MLATSTMRPMRAFSARVPPSHVTPCSLITAFSTSTPPAKYRRTQHPVSRASKSPFAASLSIRHASTTSPSSPASTSPAQQSRASPNLNQSQLTWNDFLKLRRTRRKISVVASSVSALATTYAGMSVFVQNNYDTIWAASFGLDPIVVAGLSSVGLMALGWLLGPMFGNAAFNAFYRKIRGEIESKEREFYKRIKDHRVDPTSSSMANPVPDYYGEKIGSVAGYRRWLKDQRAFNLKRGAYTGSK